MAASQSAIVGAILGTAVGDALGLPYEGISRRRGVRLLGEPDAYHFLFRHGMVSDDTEHTCMVAQALIAAGADADAYVRHLGRSFRWWLVGLPAGIGWATLRAILKLWCGFGPKRSGVFSAGNGPAMRCAILGAAIDDLPHLCALIAVTTRITHTDPKAEYGALAVALAARHARIYSEVDGGRYLEELRSSLPQDAATEFLPLMEAARRSATAGESTTAFAEAQGWRRGVSGYVYRTVPAAVHAWLRHRRDFRAAVTDVIRCGGDTDTTAAIVGGIIGSAVGKAGIPPDWLATLFEWPRTVAWMEQLGEELGRTLAEGKTGQPPHLSALGLLGRNQFFLLIVLAHVLRRCLPPY
jgi:ADP-ribosyl-[dinitrogen reductase] hydrolase